MKRSCLILAALILALGARSAIAQTPHNKPAEQIHFSAEDGSVKNPVAIPREVLAILRHDSMMRDSLSGAEPPIEEIPSTWLSASVVHLAGPDEKDLVIEAEGELRGANICKFWVFAALPSGYRLVLAAPAHDLIVLKETWEGFHKIELLSATAVSVHTVLLRLEGDRYKPYSDNWDPTQ